MTKEEIRKLIQKNGRNNQAVICMEECAELTQAISKHIRASNDDRYAFINPSNLIEEMADVTICLEILKVAYNISNEELNTMIAYKEKRIRERYEI